MDFEDHINSNFKTKTIFEYDIDDFSKEEIKIIKIYWKKYLKKLDDHVVLSRKYKWESKKIGAGPPPIRTREGWLLITHGVDENRVYRIGASLLDLDNPQEVIARSSNPILEPEMNYEIIGDVDNVVFPTGAVEKKGKLSVFYGAGDTRCCLATCNLDKLTDSLLKEK